MMHRLSLCLVLMFGLSACTWVEVSPAGKEVMLVKPSNVTNCRYVGVTTSTVKGAIGNLNRPEHKVTEELQAMAKNQAAVMGGDSIIAKNETRTQSTQAFDVYKCGY